MIGGELFYKVSPSGEQRLYDYRSNVVCIENPTGGYQKFVYATLNRVTAINSNGNLTGFRYNAYKEILEASDPTCKVEYTDGSFEYKMPDALGNIYRNKDHSDREYSAGGRLLRDSQYNYFYDGEGNLTLKTRRKTPGIASLDYIPPRRWGREKDLRYVPPKKYTEEEKKALLAS